ncbi:MAG TPA: hypothetical protein VIV82_06340, partial [Verrucomicrobiae bacterium]
MFKIINKSAESGAGHHLACALLMSESPEVKRGVGVEKRLSVKRQDDGEIKSEMRRSLGALLAVAIGLSVILPCAVHFFPQINGIGFSILPAALVWGSFLTHAKEVGDTLP